MREIRNFLWLGWNRAKQAIADDKGITVIELFTRNSSANVFQW